MRTLASRRVLFTAGALAAVTVLGACDSGGGDDGPEVADLGTVIVSDTPPGFVPITESFGPFNLDQYIERFSTSVENDREELEEVGFERGYARGWINPEGTGLVVFVFETDSNGDAEHLMEYFVDDAKDSRDGQEFEVEGIDGAEGVTYVERSIEGGETVHGVLFVRGERLYLTASQHPDLAAGRETILQFARTQAQLAK